MTETNSVEKVWASVVSLGTHNGKPTLQIEVPEWPGRYPITIYNPDPELTGGLRVGSGYEFTLHADRLKEGKDASQPFNYFWSVLHVDSGDVQAEPPAPPPARAGRQAPPPEQPPHPAEREATRPAPRPPGPSSQDGRDRSIYRSVALQQAVAFWGSANEGRVVSPNEEVLETADQFFDWLMGGES